MIAESDSLVEQEDKMVEELEITTENSVNGIYEPETEVVKKQSSVSVQTIPLEYVGRNRSTQDLSRPRKYQHTHKRIQ